MLVVAAPPRAAIAAPASAPSPGNTAACAAAGLPPSSPPPAASPGPRLSDPQPLDTASESDGEEARLLRLSSASSYPPPESPRRPGARRSARLSRADAPWAGWLDTLDEAVAAAAEEAGSEEEEERRRLLGAEPPGPGPCEPQPRPAARRNSSRGCGAPAIAEEDRVSAAEAMLASAEAAVAAQIGDTGDSGDGADEALADVLSAPAAEPLLADMAASLSAVLVRRRSPASSCAPSVQRSKEDD